MTWHADLSPWSTLPSSDAKLVAIGWLEPDRPYVTDATSRSDVIALCCLLQDPWQPNLTAGRHACGLCTFSGGPAEFALGDRRVSLGTCNLFVPGQGRVFVAPSTIIHYIDAHRYAPPPEFLEAVRACPPMRSPAYFAALLANGARPLVQPSGRPGG